MTLPVVDQARIDRNWRAITAELDAPRPSFVERVLRRVGMSSNVTRLIVASPALRRAWFASLGVAVLVGLGNADGSDPDSLFALLVLAPLVPVLGVALSYGTAADPSYEAHLAAPMRGIRLLALRAATVLVVSIVLIGALSLLSANVGWTAAAWMLPGVALTTSSVAAMTVLSPRRATALVGTLWLVGVLIAQAAANDQLAAFGAIGQVVALSIAVAAAGVVVLRRDHFDHLELTA
ncbi:MAG: hypothetical protein QNJ12_03215 [Ilumatobacter sp.]|uniref:hypothetical protein n=1 Tax=Ilumatobacter sp. TaxID=1967498 RepID=UPI00263436F6|nr:hypothetical protein [Ilumatobacter sp.]MDJ0767770.1 hypothetical protein [Ilumatobacter sp.]